MDQGSYNNVIYTNWWKQLEPMRCQSTAWNNGCCHLDCQEYNARKIQTIQLFLSPEDVEGISLTRCGRVMHICFSKLTIIGSDNGLEHGRHQAIIWTNAGILLIRTLGTNFSEISSEIFHFHSTKSVWKYRLRNGGNMSRSQCVNIILRYWCGASLRISLFIAA